MIANESFYNTKIVINSFIMLLESNFGIKMGLELFQIFLIAFSVIYILKELISDHERKKGAVF